MLTVSFEKSLSRKCKMKDIPFSLGLSPHSTQMHLVRNGQRTRHWPLLSFQNITKSPPTVVEISWSSQPKGTLGSEVDSRENKEHSHFSSRKYPVLFPTTTPASVSPQSHLTFVSAEINYANKLVMLAILLQLPEKKDTLLPSNTLVSVNYKVFCGSMREILTKKVGSVIVR